MEEHPSTPPRKKTLKTVFIRCQTCPLIDEIYLMCQAGLIKKERKAGWAVMKPLSGPLRDSDWTRTYLSFISHFVSLFFCFTLITIHKWNCGDGMMRDGCMSQLKKKKKKSKESKKKTFNLHFSNILRGRSDFYKPPFIIIIISSISSECLCVYTCCK